MSFPAFLQLIVDALSFVGGYKKGLLVETGDGR
jgi:hypothetical protein